ncbi:LacI family DNA-binding transcriptional regulator [Arthrobacter sp. AL12]|uniref:LacI family DNA-binding transcriptional regulator n=1 Tax=Arthrobacter sp. AL12 TaxID=3042241 RepID=UPI00249BF903|nr:LacI family DNA-binding transcriptional regulator [Arthrobacter sp. AL12]MDI3213596.1 LacI family DNA-binding transcriptional regulator [Arthrobacter sp. AL12]
MTSRPTLASLAEQLGLSRQTVSNAINAPERVKPETLRRVNDTIAATGYRPNAAARQLRTRRSRNLGFRLMPVEDGINGAILDRFLHSLTENLQEHGYRVTLFAARDDEAEIRSYDELLETSDLDGFVLAGTHHGDARSDWLLARSVPFVTFGRPWNVSGDDKDCAHSWVDVDGRAGTAEATNYLLGRGHRRIGFLGWPAGSGVGDDRRAGWASALDEALTPADLDALSVGVPDGTRQGAEGARLLLERGATAVVCASDSLALGASEQFRAATPGNPAAVIGFDDTPVAAAMGLSSVAQPVEQAAKEIVDIMRHVLDGAPDEQVPVTHRLLKPRLVLRDGGGPLASPLSS